MTPQEKGLLPRSKMASFSLPSFPQEPLLVPIRGTRTSGRPDSGNSTRPRSLLSPREVASSPPAQRAEWGRRRGAQPRRGRSTQWTQTSPRPPSHCSPAPRPTLRSAEGKEVPPLSAPPSSLAPRKCSAEVAAERPGGGWVSRQQSAQSVVLLLLLFILLLLFLLPLRPHCCPSDSSFCCLRRRASREGRNTLRPSQLCRSFRCPWGGGLVCGAGERWRARGGRWRGGGGVSGWRRAGARTRRWARLGECTSRVARRGECTSRVLPGMESGALCSPLYERAHPRGRAAAARSRHPL